MTPEQNADIRRLFDSLHKLYQQAEDDLTEANKRIANLEHDNSTLRSQRDAFKKQITAFESMHEDLRNERGVVITLHGVVNGKKFGLLELIRYHELEPLGTNHTEFLFMKLREVVYKFYRGLREGM